MLASTPVNPPLVQHKVRDTRTQGRMADTLANNTVLPPSPEVCHEAQAGSQACWQAHPHAPGVVRRGVFAIPP